jgi:hypothetical protein
MCFPGADVEIEPMLRVIGYGRRPDIGVQNGCREQECRRDYCSCEAAPCVVPETRVHGASLVRSAMNTGAQVAPPSAE